MLKVQILAQCRHCEGRAYLQDGEAFSNNGESYQRYMPCPKCEGSGKGTQWVTLQEFIVLLNDETNCAHEHTSYRGGFHFSAGEVWDDLIEVCDDCGANLDELHSNPKLDIPDGLEIP